MNSIYKYTNADTYEEEQIALKEIAVINGLSVHQTRARLVNMGIYHNKEKVSTRVPKSKYVDELVDLVDDLTDTEVEYIDRLTVTLLKKLIEAIKC